jgi:DNA-binding MarR family transcriptional regulator
VAVDRAEKARESLEDAILADFNAEERATLRKLLTRVRDGLLHVAPEPAKL